MPKKTYTAPIDVFAFQNNLRIHYLYRHPYERSLMVTLVEAQRYVIDGRRVRLAWGAKAELLASEEKLTGQDPRASSFGSKGALFGILGM